MNYVMSEDGSTPRDPVYICIAETQLNAVMKSLERVQGRCARQSLAMMTAGHDLRQHIHIIRAALEKLESAETVFANQWNTAKVQPCTTMIASDRRLLSVILDNLVANAVKYTNRAPDLRT